MLDDSVFFKLTDEQRADYFALRTLLYKIADVDVVHIKEAMAEHGEVDEAVVLRTAEKLVNYIEYLSELYKLPTGLFQDLTIFK